MILGKLPTNVGTGHHTQDSVLVVEIIYIRHACNKAMSINVSYNYFVYYQPMFIIIVDQPLTFHWTRHKPLPRKEI